MNEQLFQLIWSSLAFDTANLKTLSGESLEIISPGRQNPGDGPDFNNAAVSINNISFYGDIELHLKAKNWYLHKHHTDSRYNRVVLHVVLYDEDLCAVNRQDRTKPFTLVLKPYLSVGIKNSLIKRHAPSLLPCHGLAGNVPPEVVRTQWIQAQNEYFEQKVNELLTFYSDTLPPSEAWKNMLTTGLFDGMGISNNRSAMVQLHKFLFTEGNKTSESLSVLIKRALLISGIHGPTKHSEMHRNDWDFSSCRPNNQPNVRIPQACLLHFNIRSLPFQQFLNDDLKKIWKEITKSDESIDSIGKERLNVLFYTVFLPAMHLLAVLFLIPSKKHETFKLWSRNKMSVPDKIKKKYPNGLFPTLIKEYPAGTIYQFKHYCSEGRCSDCKLMKSILKS